MQFAPRPNGFSCPRASDVQSYCDSADPYCCNGKDANTHQGYGREYGQDALRFVNGKLSSGGKGSTDSTDNARSNSNSNSNSNNGNNNNNQQQHQTTSASKVSVLSLPINTSS